MEQNKKSRPRGVDSARIRNVIETKTLRGEGTEEDPCREVTQYWSLVGKFLAEYDPVKKEKE